MADGTPKKPSITFGNEVCNINASEPGSAMKADGAIVRLPVFVVDDVLASTGSTATASTAASTSDVPVEGTLCHIATTYVTSPCLDCVPTGTRTPKKGMCTSWTAYY